MAKKPEASNLPVQPSPGVSDLELNRPAFIPATQQGTEHIEKSDIELPRLALAQQMSPQLAEGDPKFIDDLKIGDMFNSLTRHIYGRGPLTFAIVRADRPRYIEFFPRSAGGGVKDMNVPPGDPRTQFSQDENGNPLKPVATKYYDYVLMSLETKEIIALSLKSSGLKVARALNTLMKLRNAPCYAGAYTVTAAMDRNQKGTFAVYRIQNAGWITDENLYKHAEKMYQSLSNKTLKIDRDTDEDPLAGDGVGGPEGTGSTDFPAGGDDEM